MWEDDDDHDDEGFDQGLRELHAAPLRQKAREIGLLTQALVQSLAPATTPHPDDAALLPPENQSEEPELRPEDVRGIGELMLSNGFQLAAKLAAARATTDYGRSMELAMLIKVAAESLLTQTSLCRELRLTHPDYIQTLRRELDEFRLLFRDWVATFDPTDHYDDGWGLFRA
ncbi:hypothetical protein [Hymenobacter yonginensis]|uniref:Uncharacterized protein n=1 Tax=Hymenobacter yonginensis TaxID=748197 RepID=A0ABY7PLE1_9BACT|nr:hypothetical protein [Hymenobacter yonginensis]WBO84004.1 hypothetical protein O9Z63_16695 [Hymenobacter yonginensis]